MRLPSQNGFRVVMSIGAVTALIALVIVSFIPPRPAPSTEFSSADAEPADATL